MKNWTTSKKILIWGSVSVISLIGLGFIIWKRTPFKKRLVDVANGEWKLFGYQTIGKDGKLSRVGTNPFGIPFIKSSAHNKYIREYIANRKEGRLSAAFVGYRISEVSPKVGDLVCYGREGQGGYDATNSYKGHCDIVVAKRPGEIEAIGGNVSDSVTKRILSTDKKGRLIDRNNNWFAIIKNNA